MANTPERKTLGSYVDLPGEPLDTVENESVVVTEITITKRRLRDNADAPFAIIKLDDGRELHTWSPYLIEKLEQVPAEALPGPTTFKQEVTANKRKVWVME